MHDSVPRALVHRWRTERALALLTSGTPTWLAEDIMRSFARSTPNHQHDHELVTWAVGVLVVRHLTQLTGFVRGYKDRSMLDPLLPEWEIGDGFLISQTQGITLKRRWPGSAPVLVMHFAERDLEHLLARLIPEGDPLTDEINRRGDLNQNLTTNDALSSPGTSAAHIELSTRDLITRRQRQTTLERQSRPLLDFLWRRALTPPLYWDTNIPTTAA